jgi:hypothetical protein
MNKKIKISIGILILVAVIFLVRGGLTGNVIGDVSASQEQGYLANAASGAGSCGGGSGGGGCGSPSCGAATGGSCGGGGSGGCGG